MRKAPRTGPGPLCRAAAGLGKFGGSRRKGLPRRPGSALSPRGDGSVPSCPGDVSAALAPGTGHRAPACASSLALGTMQDGAEGTQRDFGGDGAAWSSRERARRAAREQKGTPHTPWGHGAVPKVNVPRAPKPGRQRRAGSRVQQQRPRGHPGAQQPLPNWKAKGRGSQGTRDVRGEGAPSPAPCRAHRLLRLQGHFFQQLQLHYGVPACATELY